MYRSVDELPGEVRQSLPQPAWELYRAVYNRVIEKRGDAGESDEIAKTAHRAGMLAVHAEFRRDADGRWHHEPVGEQMNDTGPKEGR